MIKQSKITALKPRETPYKVGIRKSLYILVHPSGGKYWRFKYRIKGKEKVLALGVFPQVTMQAALEATDQARRLLKNGVDPAETYRASKKERMKANPGKTAFRMNLSAQGELAVETKTRIIRLTKPQTDALRSFLIASQEEHTHVD